MNSALDGGGWSILKYTISHNSALYIKTVYEVSSLILQNEWQYGDGGTILWKVTTFVNMNGTPCVAKPNHVHFWSTILTFSWTGSVQFEHGTFATQIRGNQTSDSGVVQPFKLRSVTYVAHTVNSNTTVRANIQTNIRRFLHTVTARQRPHNLHETYQLPRVQLITPDDGHTRCPKHVEFRDKIKFWVLDASCWLLYEDYHDARSLEHKIPGSTDTASNSKSQASRPQS
jgi:REP element-mobilizing transposase RayT